MVTLSVAQSHLKLVPSSQDPREATTPFFHQHWALRFDKSIYDNDQLIFLCLMIFQVIFSPQYTTLVGKKKKSICFQLLRMLRLDNYVGQRRYRHSHRSKTRQREEMSSGVSGWKSRQRRRCQPISFPSYSLHWAKRFSNSRARVLSAMYFRNIFLGRV